VTQFRAIDATTMTGVAWLEFQYWCCMTGVAWLTLHGWSSSAAIAICSFLGAHQNSFRENLSFTFDLSIRNLLRFAYHALLQILDDQPGGVFAEVETGIIRV